MHVLRWADWTNSDDGFNTAFQSRGQIDGIGPYAIILSDVEMQVFKMILSTGPKDGTTEAHCKACFKVNSAPMASKICNQKP
jgi:hypothetical protein